jgi:hypothetical protein
MSDDDELFEFPFDFVRKTEKAILVSDGIGEDIWLPKSQIVIEHGAGDAITVKMPGWLARKKGLL